MKRKNILIFLLLSLVLGFIVYFLLHFFSIIPPNPLRTYIYPEQPKYTTYANKNFGISFSYPSVLTINESGNSTAYTVFFRGLNDQKIYDSGTRHENTSEMIAIHVFKNRPHEEEVSRLKSNIRTITKESPTTVSGFPAVTFEGQSNSFGQKANSVHTVIQTNSSVVTVGIEWTSDQQLRNYFDTLRDSLQLQ